MMTILHSPTLLTLKRHSWQKIQQISDLEVLQFLDGSKKGLEMLNRYPLAKKLFVQHIVLLSSAPVERLFSFAH